MERHTDRCDQTHHHATFTYDDTVLKHKNLLQAESVTPYVLLKAQKSLIYLL